MMDSGLKRGGYTALCNESDDDCGSDDDNRHCAVSSGTAMAHRNPTRKRRRGVIEKRRRDRINMSLDELKRLVPQALEKSGSAKLEKAEILQMTVDHLKFLHTNKAYDSNVYKSAASPAEAHRIAMDYHGLGFRECAAEVARYLFSVEGLDVQDPLRIRLMSHLQMFMTNRGANAGVGAAGQQQMMMMNQTPHPPAAAPQGPGGPVQNHMVSWNTHYASPAYSMPDPYSPVAVGSESLSYFVPASAAAAAAAAAASSASASSSATVPTSVAAGAVLPLTSTPSTTSPSITPLAATTSSSLSQWHTSYSSGSGVPLQQHFVGGGGSSGAFGVASQSAYGKPYRPWGGTEMAC